MASVKNSRFLWTVLIMVVLAVLCPPAGGLYNFAASLIITSGPTK